MKSDIKLKNVISTNKVKIFDTDQGVFIADVEEYDTFNINDPLNIDPTSDIIYNVSNMLDVNRNTMLQNFYEISDLDGQSFRSPISRNEWTNTPDDYVKQYNADDLEYMSITQLDQFGFILSEDTIDGLRDETYNYDNTFGLVNSPVNLYVYPPSGQLVLSGYPVDINEPYVDSDLSGNMIPLYNLSGVGYNYMGEIDCDNRYFDYMTPTFYSNHTNTKTHLNTNYNTGSMVTSPDGGTSLSATLTNTREYVKIGSSDNLLYMTYRYSRDYDSDLTSTIDGRTTDDYSFETLSATKVTDINMTGHSNSVTGVPSTGDDFAKRFNYVESIGVNTLGGLGKYDTQTLHKTNVYSINIQNANINSSDDMTDDVKENIKKSVSNVIRDMVESCTPVNTQLIDINWNGE